MSEQPLFESFESWAARNTDIADSIRKDIDKICPECDAHEIEDDFDVDPDDCLCGGSGQRLDEDIESEVTEGMRDVYNAQLERDYRNALHLMGAA